MQKQIKTRRRIAAPVGGLFLALAVIGIISVATAAIGLTSRFLDNQTEKDRLTALIRPVAMFDPVPFETPTDIKMENLLQYSMWAALSTPKDRERKNVAPEGEAEADLGGNQGAELVVPASDLDVACQKLFGPEVELVHQSFSDYDTMYSYTEEEKVYIISTAAQTMVYRPEVVDIQKDGEFYSLLVDYYPPQNIWSMNYGGAREAIAEKRMIFLMSKEGSDYHIAKVQDLPPLAAPVSGEPVAQG